MSDNTPKEKRPSHSNRRIVLASIVALFGGVLIILAIVLPAEFGVDPLRTGRLLGLDSLAQPAQAVTPRHEVHKTDSAEFVLEPFQSLEYKYLMDIGDTLIFSWQADGDLEYDMHADPAGREDGYDESYDAGTGRESMGIYEARFTGLHGWFWENQTFDTVTIRISTAGHYVNATVFQDGGTFERQLPDVFGQ